MEEKLGHLEVLKEHLCRSNSVSDWVIGRFCQKDRVFSRVDIKVFKDLPPDGFHVLPILHDTMIHWIAQSQNSLVFFSILANKSFHFISCEHDAFVFGAADTVTSKRDWGQDIDIAIISLLTNC